MGRKIYSILHFVVLVFLCFVILVQGIEARRGCCSHHGGVCNCAVSGQKCCDGTSLSATCAPYYSPCVETVVPLCSQITAGTCGGKTYTQCEQEAYNNCKKEENFWIEHEKNIRDLIVNLLEREPTEEDINFYKNVSRDINEIEAWIKNSDEYKQLQEEKAIEAAKSRDTDNDGLSDYDEENIYHTDINNSDTDGDGYKDKEEIDTGNDPLNPPEEKPEVVEEKPQQENIIDTEEDEEEKFRQKEEKEEELKVTKEAENEMVEVERSADNDYSWLVGLLIAVGLPGFVGLLLLRDYFIKRRSRK